MVLNWSVPIRRSFLVLPGILAWALGASSCHHGHVNRDEKAVRHAFDSCKAAILQRQAPEFMGFISRDVYDYFSTIAPGAAPTLPAAATSPAVTCPAVDLLLRTTLKRKLPPELRTNLTLDSLVQNLNDRGLLKSRNVEGLTLGPITVKGDHASAELFYQGTLTALRLPFVKQGNDWKIDLLAIFPYAEVLMRVDRAITGQNQDDQVDQLVNRLPEL